MVIYKSLGMLIFVRKVCVCRWPLPQPLRRGILVTQTPPWHCCSQEQAEYSKSWHLHQKRWQVHSSWASATCRLRASFTGNAGTVNRMLRFTRWKWTLRNTIKRKRLPLWFHAGRQLSIVQPQWDGEENWKDEGRWGGKWVEVKTV